MVDEIIMGRFIISGLVIFSIFFFIGFCMAIYWIYLFWKIGFRIKSIEIRRINQKKKMPFMTNYLALNDSDEKYIRNLKDKEININIEKLKILWKIYIKLLLYLVLYMIAFGIFVFILTRF